MQHLKRYEIKSKDGLTRLTEDELEAWQEPILGGVRVLTWPEIFEKTVLNDNAFQVSLVNAMGDDLEPLRSARMSTDTPTGLDHKKDSALRNRLWRDKHTSPFEVNVACFELVLPLAMLRQIDRHRTVSVSEMRLEVLEDYDDFRKFSSRNEFSARYSEMPDLFYHPSPPRFRGKDKANKQGSGDGLGPDLQRMCAAVVRESSLISRGHYRQLIDFGVSSEVARFVLPMNQVTKIRLQTSLLNWFKFLELRMAKDVQEETREYAYAIADCLKMLWPECWAVFEEHTLGAVTFSRSELADLRGLLLDVAKNEPLSKEREKLFEKLRGRE